MLPKKIKYTDYNGVEREETFYFNLSKAELMEMEMGTAGGFSQYLKDVVDAQDAPTLMKLFKEIILKAYGKKSEDGKRFMKSAEISSEFEQSEAYSVLLMEIISDDKIATDFINNILPADLIAEANKQNHPALNK